MTRGMDEFFLMAQKMNMAFCVVAVVVVALLGAAVYCAIKKQISAQRRKIMVDLEQVVTSDVEAKDFVTEYLSQKMNLPKDVISNAITDVSNTTKYSDGEDIFVVHKKTKSNKDKLIYVMFASWLIEQ